MGLIYMEDSPYGLELQEELSPGSLVKFVGLRKISAGTVVDSKASVAMLKKLGFKLEGTFRQEFLADGEYRDVKWSGLFRDEIYKFSGQSR